jgi:hypothetical protein
MASKTFVSSQLEQAMTPLYARPLSRLHSAHYLQVAEYIAGERLSYGLRTLGITTLGPLCM